jgi:outer membrane protein assembly factor BamE (lipoprotein component of BamABCDE complex)
MKMFVKTGSLLTAALMIAGCASIGNQSLQHVSERSVQTKMTEGVTTKRDVRSTYGSPIKTSFTDGGLEIWTYEFSNVSLDAVSYIPIVNWFGTSASGKKKELVVLFDKAGLVQRYSMSESDVSQKTGIFNN